MAEGDAMMLSDDLELITLYLNGRLTAEERADVERRLDSDTQFRELVEPMMFAWAVSAESNRRPVASEELEDLWDEFTKRAGFVHQKKRTRTRRLWIVAIVLAAIGLTGFVTRGSIERAYRDWRDYVTVARDTGWISLRPHIHVQLAEDARLRMAKRIERNVQRVKLEGSARFRVEAVDTTQLVPHTIPVVVSTRAGEAFSGEGEFTVGAIGDTTIVQMHQPTRRRYMGFLAFPTSVLVRTDLDADPHFVRENQRVRMVRGAPPERIQP